MKLTQIARSLALCTVLSAPLFSTSASAAVADDSFKSVGYLPIYRAYTINQIEFNKLTHVMYSFARPDANGNIYIMNGGSAADLANIRQKAHAVGTQVGIALGGWDDNYSTARIFENLTADPTTRANLIQNIVNFTKQHQLDGVDMDWEHPTASSAANYETFMIELGDALHAENLFLSAAVVSYGSLASHIRDGVLAKVDFLNLMAYDAQGPHHSSMQVAIDSVSYWKSRNIDANKLVLGVPFYSRGAAVQTYAQIIQQSTDNACVDDAGGKKYNGIPTIRQKTQYAIDNVGGIMNWELGQDSFGQYSLLSAMDDVINQVDDTVCASSVEPTPSVTPTPTTAPTTAPTPAPTLEPTPAPTAPPVTGDIIAFVPGKTKVSNGDVVSYDGKCYQAKNNPGVWETPRLGSWFWTETACATPTQAPTQAPTPEPTATPEPTLAPSPTPTPVPTTAPTEPPQPTQVPTEPPTSAVPFVLGQTKVSNGDVVSYKASCYAAKNSPGTWETPRVGSWFWEQVTCP
ncbi:glycosyl hydrolase family 18 protein [Motilimonas pumila]|uniref:GH18 domain-containing protein n=1 Tax=Motilimonas pumila TaxID=2303987 RepID=A0A418YG61_9GAMM|nr:glycosyl hydrolase family 18 protein [Motilimonas pumila]RJG48636.1 hypothetical protein D1Z90_07190 [Motilimonas pumila]